MPGWLWVFIGGAIGSVSRYGMSSGLSRLSHLFLPGVINTYPLGTLGVNLSGCLLIGVMIGFSGGFNTSPPDPIRMLCMIGFLGGFTTFSGYALELARLINTGNPADILRAGIYFLLSNLLGVAMVFGGNWLGNRLQG